MDLCFLGDGATRSSGRVPCVWTPQVQHQPEFATSPLEADPGYDLVMAPKSTRLASDCMTHLLGADPIPNAVPRRFVDHGQSVVQEPRYTARALSGTMRISAILAFASLSLLMSASVSIAGEWPAPIESASTPVNIAFPSFTTENRSAELVALFSIRLGLGNVLSLNITPAGQDSPIDGLGNILPNRPGVLVQDLVEASTTVGAKLELYYAFPGGPESHFVYAIIWPLPVNASLRTDPGRTLRSVATALGVPLDGTEKTLQHTLGDQNHTTIYRPYANESIEFADQIQLIFHQGNNSIASLWLYPWIQQVPPATITEGQAAASVQSYVNETYGRENYSLNRSSAQFALDARAYAFAYSFRLWYSGKDFWTNGDLWGAVWVDAQTGQVLLVDLVVIVPAGPRPASGLSWAYLALATALLGSVLVALGYSAISNESARFAIVAVLSFPFFILRREKSLQHFVRGQIYEYLRLHPGATFTDIRDDLSLKNGSAAHHLMVLERMGFLVSQREGRLKHFFRSDAVNMSVEGRVSPMQYAILSVLAQEELTQSDLARRLGVSKQRVGYNVRALVKRGLLNPPDERGRLRATPAGTALLDDATSGEAPVARA